MMSNVVLVSPTLATALAQQPMPLGVVNVLVLYIVVGVNVRGLDSKMGCKWLCSGLDGCI